MLSSNLVKQFFVTQPAEEGKRIIDSNAVVRRRLAEQPKAGRGISDTEDEGEGGFVSGLIPTEVLEAPEDRGNVIKARDEAAEILEQARAEVEKILAEAWGEAEKIRSEAKAQAEAEKIQVLSQAKQQGYNEGLVKAQAREGALEQEYREKTRRLEEEYQQEIDSLEPRFVDAITGIYEHIFHVELSSYREILVSLISDVLHKLEGGRNFIIHVAKEDYPYVNMQKKQMLAGAVSEGSRVDVVEDLTLTRNGCMIETENGIFDCGLGTQLEELQNRLRILAWSAGQE